MFFTLQFSLLGCDSIHIQWDRRGPVESRPDMGPNILRFCLCGWNRLSRSGRR